LLLHVSDGIEEGNALVVGGNWSRRRANRPNFLKPVLSEEGIALPREKKKKTETDQKITKKGGLGKED